MDNNRARTQIANEATISWFKKLFKTPLDDYSKFVVWRILTPLINIRKSSANEASNVIGNWLDRCRSLRQLDFRPNYNVRHNINSAQRGWISTDKSGKTKDRKYLNPKNIYAWYRKGHGFHSLGRYEAIACFDNALEIDPNDSNYWNLKAWLFANIDRNAEALSIIIRSLELNPNNPDALDTKGFILYNTGKYYEAIEYFNKALEIDPNHAEEQYHKSLTLKRLSQL